MYDFVIVFGINTPQNILEALHELVVGLEEMESGVRIKIIDDPDDLEDLELEVEELRDKVNNKTEVLVWGCDAPAEGDPSAFLFRDHSKVGVVDLINVIRGNQIVVGYTPEGRKLFWKPSNIHFSSSTPERLQAEVEVEVAKLDIPVTISAAGALGFGDQAHYINAYEAVPFGQTFNSPASWREVAGGKFVLKAAASSQKLIYIDPALSKTLVVPASESYAATTNHTDWSNTLVDFVTGERAALATGQLVPLIEIKDPVAREKEELARQQTTIATQRAIVQLNRLRRAYLDPYVKTLVNEGDPMGLMEPHFVDPTGLARERLDSRLRSLIAEGDAAKFSQFVSSMRGTEPDPKAPVLIYPLSPLTRHDALRDTSLMQLACTGGQVAIVELLLREGVSAVDPVSSDGQTPLMLAAAEGHTQLVKLLLDSMSAQDAQRALNRNDNQGDGALYMALQGDFIATANELLARGSDASDALMSAVTDRDLGIMQTLLAVQGIDVNVVDEEGRTLLMLALDGPRSTGIPVIIELLLNSRVNHLAKDADGRTAIDYAVANNNGLAVAALVKRAPEFAHAESEGQPLIWLAIVRGWSDAALALIEQGAAVDAVGAARRGGPQSSVLMEAISQNDRSVFEALLEKGAPVQGSAAVSPLDLAVIKRFQMAKTAGTGSEAFDDNLSIIKALLSRNATTNQTTMATRAANANIATSALLMPTFLATQIRSTTVGRGAYIGENVVIWGGTQVKDFARIEEGAQIGEFVTIGVRARVGANASVAMGMQVLPYAHVPANHVLRVDGLYLKNGDGTLTFVSDGAGIGIATRMAASAGPLDLPGSPLRDQDPDAPAGAFASGEVVPGERIDHDPEVHNKGAQGEALWKGALSEVTTGPLLGPEGARPALSAAEYRAHIERNLGFALQRVFVAEQLDPVVRAALVAEAQSVFMKYILPVVEKALAELAPAGDAISLDALSAKLGERSAAEHLADSIEAADPKSGVLRQQALRQAAILLAQLNGDLRNQVAARNVLLPEPHLDSVWREVYERLGGGNRAQTRNRFNQHMQELRDKGKLGVSSERAGELFEYVWLIIDKQRQLKAGGGAGIGVAAGQSAEQALLQASPKQVAQPDAADLAQLWRDAFGVSPQKLPLTLEASHTQFNDFMDGMNAARDAVRSGVPQLVLSAQLRAHDELVQASERQGSPGLGKAMGHYSLAIGTDGLFLALGALAIHQTLQARARAVDQGLDTRDIDASLLHQVAMTGTMSALLAGRVAEGVASVLGAGKLAAGLQEALGRAGGAFTGVVVAQQLGDIIAAGIKYAQDSQHGSLTQEDKWALGGSSANLAVTLIGIGVSMIPFVGPELAAAAQFMLPNWAAFGRAEDLLAQAKALREQGLHHEADLVATLSALSWDKGLPIAGQFADLWSASVVDPVFRATTVVSAEASLLLGHLIDGSLSVPADAIGVNDQYISISQGAPFLPQGALRDLVNRLTGTVIVPVRRDLASNPEDWSQVVKASARAMRERIDAQGRAEQDWFHQAYSERVQPAMLGKSDEIALLDQQMRQYQGVLDMHAFGAAEQQKMDHYMATLKAWGLWDYTHHKRNEQTTPSMDVPEPFVAWVNHEELRRAKNAHETLEPLQRDAVQRRQDILERQGAHSYEWRSQADVLLGQLQASGGAFKSAWLINSHAETFDYDSGLYQRSGAYSLHNDAHGNAERVDGSTALHLKAPADWAPLDLPQRPTADADEAHWSAYTEQLKQRYDPAHSRAHQQNLKDHAGLTLQSHFSGTAAPDQADSWELGAFTDSALVIVQDDSGHTDRRLIVDAHQASGAGLYLVQRDNVSILAGEGDDLVQATSQAGLLVDGGEGQDTLSLQDAASGRTLVLEGLTDVEHLIGSAHADTLSVAADAEPGQLRSYHWGGGGADSVSLLDASSYDLTIGAGDVQLGAGNDLVSVARADGHEGALQVDGGGGHNTLSLGALAGVRVHALGSQGYAWSAQAAAAAATAATAPTQPTAPTRPDPLVLVGPQGAGAGGPGAGVPAAAPLQHGHFSRVQSLQGSFGDDDIELALGAGVLQLNAGLGEDRIVVRADEAPASDEASPAPASQADTTLGIDGGGGHDSILVRQAKGVRIAVDQGHDVIELDAGVQQLDLGLGLFPVAGVAAPKATVYAQHSAAQLRLDLAQGELELHLGSGGAAIQLYSAYVQLRLHDNAARTGDITIQYKPGVQVKLEPELLAGLVQLQGAASSAAITVQYTDTGGQAHSVALRELLGQPASADASTSSLRIGQQPHQLTVWQGVPTRIALERLVAGAYTPEQAQAYAAQLDARIAALSPQLQALQASVDQLHAQQLAAEHGAAHGTPWSASLTDHQLQAFAQQGAPVGRVQSAWDYAFGEPLTGEQAAWFDDQVIYNPHTGKLAATLASVEGWLGRLEAANLTHQLRAPYQLNTIVQRMRQAQPHSLGQQYGRYDLDDDNAVSIGLLRELADAGIFQGQVLTAVHSDERGDSQFEGAWLEQVASVPSEHEGAQLLLQGSGIQAVYTGQAWLDAQTGQASASAQTLALWKTSLLDKLQPLQDQLEQLQGQRAHNEPYSVQALDGQAPAWAQLAAGSLQLTAPEWSGNQPLEIIGRADGRQASHILHVDSQRFDGLIQLGSDHADSLHASAGVANLLAGGRGNDSYWIDAGADAGVDNLVFENAGEGYDNVYSEHSARLEDHVERLVLGAQGSGVRTGVGNAQDNQLSSTRGHGSDQLSGLGGNDSLASDAGADRLDGGEGDDVLFGGGGADSLLGGAGQDTLVLRGKLGDYSFAGGLNIGPLVLTGEGGALQITDRVAGRDGVDSVHDIEHIHFQGDGRTLSVAGGHQRADAAGHDLLIGHASGPSTMHGGLGDDSYLVARGSAVTHIQEQRGQGHDRIVFGPGLALADARLGLGSLKISFASGEEVHIDAFDAADPLGNPAIEDFVFQDTGETLSLAQLLARGFDLAGSAGADSIGGTALADRIVAGAGNDTLMSGAGDDRLDGGSGTDAMAGGAGDDTYLVDHFDDRLIENPNEGIDSVIASAGYYSLAGAPEVENLTLVGNAALYAVGNGAANILTGNARDNVLDGGTGIDTLAGGAGNDYYVVDHAGDILVEKVNEGIDTAFATVSYSLANAPEVENLTLVDGAALDATGNQAANTLTGNTGKNILDGAGDSDTVVLRGVAADYTFMRANGVIYAGDRVAGRDGLDQWKNIERVSFRGSGQTVDIGALNIPSALDYIASYPDLMDAYGANEAAGASHYWTTGYAQGRSVSFDALKYIGSSADLLTYFGADTAAARAHYFSYGRHGTHPYDGTLASQLGTSGADALSGSGGNDALFGLEGNDTLAGGAGADGLSGGAGADRLDGGAGADQMGGGAGNDVYIVDHAQDVVAENAGAAGGRDTIQASVSYALGANLAGINRQLYDNVEELMLTGSANIDATGNALANTLIGNTGSNRLAGGAGNDTLMGSWGADSYQFERGGGQDVISDAESFGASIDTLQFGAGIGFDQLWLRKVASASLFNRYDLEIQVMGSSDKVTIAGWERVGGFAPHDPNANHIELIKAADGKTLADTKVAQLVQAMAGMAPPTGATSWSQLAPSQQAQLQALGAWG